ncbi:substrate-binding domain-containing protein [Tenacibaculum finnmarkense]|uniref:ABC transporter substrate-binding protein n=1 Tax=Tenacibaculum finnmarkense genomovar ulcerans TaxID=2781388 RepID=A0A2I2MCZ6_9FLAO|nr:substrate-binding domain-containing protein [Tenacibaculum finnmarkense]ALU74812.1 ABC transporter substrate-binding protein [Tenacibaculum dicentrarchi]MBE7634606.1 ABC transporter substrate-binding protein [Tenacibaculum finnmarkense genomovar ulcerans]MBE7698456.1 ABC transporter substrate-binding protein [Tenacibaculum finnmarkense genomovar ulcerans]MCD8400906.1 substrate-binding domain-containing protein [Tenacibaculum finnmarkense genomovar ulcerans]MCD8410796.1 substrate-binding dom
MTTLKIGGVPEHFNYPWYVALKNKEFTKQNINLRWQDFPGGTGAMCKALRAGDVDIAIVLTEGIIKDISNGNPSKITQTFVKSPLIWGIHVAANSGFKKIEDLENATVAISRFGSGSHLMAIVNAHNNGWDIDQLKFKVVGSLQGGIDALTNGDADYFMWEHFTTKPLVDNATFRRLGDCPTPWPCFVIAVRNEVLENNFEEVKKVLAIINQYTGNFKDTPDIDKILAHRYEQQLDDIQKWLSITQWNDGEPITEKLISSIQNKMQGFNVIDTKKDSAELIRNMYL